MDFDGFYWDDGNRDKCRKHGVSVEEIEEVLTRAPLVIVDGMHSADEPRFHAVGASKAGRAVFVVFTFRVLDEQSLLRPISARYMHGREIARYERAQAISRSEER